MNLIVACDLNWQIGRGGDLLFRIPDDLKRFKSLTTGHPVILGRKTLATFPGGRPLPNRPNLILSRNRSYRCDSAIVARSLKQLRKKLEAIGDPDPFVIGGSEVYRQLLPYCHRAYVTKVYRQFEADSTFPDLDAHPDWTLSEEGPVLAHEDLEYRFCLYENQHVEPLP